MRSRTHRPTDRPGRRRWAVALATLGLCLGTGLSLLATTAATSPAPTTPVPYIAVLHRPSSVGAWGTPTVPPWTGGGFPSARVPGPLPTPRQSPPPTVHPVVTTPVLRAGLWPWPVRGRWFISQYYSAFHPAVDIAAAWGTPVAAVAPGQVLFAGWKDNGGGFQVWLAQAGGYETGYYHLSAILVATGQVVTTLTILGRVGATGDATGPHLHFEVWRGPMWAGGVRLNPLWFI